MADTAAPLHGLGFLNLKVDPFIHPLRKEPLPQAVMRELKFPTAGATRSFVEN